MIDIECRGPANNKRLMQEGHAVYERENIRKDGVKVPIEVSARIVNREGKGLIMSFVRDISERKRMEAKITESLKHMEQAQQIAKLGSYEYNFAEDSYIFSKEARRILGFLPADRLITYERFMNCVHPDDLEHLRQFHASSIVRGQPFDFYYRIVRSDGEIRQVHGQGDCTFSPDGKPLRLSGTIQDITDRKLVEEELARHRDRLEQLVEERTKELENKTITLEEVNIALKVLLRNREEDKKDMESRFVMNVKTLINPYLEKMKSSPLDVRQLAYLNIIEAHANNITTPMIKQMHQFNFTPMEVEVALLIKGGKSTKEISKIIGIAYSSVNSHRINIRKKLGISKKGGNLQSQLQSLD
jgi:PAS domain S-box-containing protein